MSSKNTNCLEGIKCPGCGNEDRFVITVTALATVTDDGFTRMEGGDWDDSSHIRCPECGADGAVATFTAEEERHEPGDTQAREK
jgi:hypothetical protein